MCRCPVCSSRTQVVCGKCSEFRARLWYDNNRTNRVCVDCYAMLVGVSPCPGVLTSSTTRRRSILEVGGTPLRSNPFVCGYDDARLMLTLAHSSQFCLSPVETGVPGGREQCDLLLSPPHGERSRAGLAEGLVRRPR